MKSLSAKLSRKFDTGPPSLDAVDVMQLWNSELAAPSI
jgi:hypothetical protein